MLLVHENHLNVLLMWPRRADWIPSSSAATIDPGDDTGYGTTWKTWKPQIGTNIASEKDLWISFEEAKTSWKPDEVSNATQADPLGTTSCLACGWQPGLQQGILLPTKNNKAFSNFNGSSWKFWKFIQDIQDIHIHSKELYKFFLNPTNALPPCANSSCNWERLGILQGKSTKFGKLFSGTFSATSRWLETTNSPALDERCRQS